MKTTSSSLTTQASRGCLEALGFNLGLGGFNRSSGVRIDEATTLLAILELGANARANTSSLTVVCATSFSTVRIRDAATGGELLSLSVSYVSGARVVGDGLREGGGGDYIPM